MVGSYSNSAIADIPNQASSADERNKAGTSLEIKIKRAMLSGPSVITVRRSDIYIGIIGTRYGSVDKHGVSITQREYEQAFEGQKAILIFLLDEGKHPVLPRNVETGTGAEKLTEFKKLLMSRRVCSLFSSAEELALKVSIALARLLHIDQGSDHDERRIEELKRQVPVLLAASGYGVTLGEHVSDLSGIFASGEDGRITISDHQLRKLLTAGYIATRLSKGDFTTLKDIMTFDKDFWALMIVLLGHYGIDPESLSSEISTCSDPVQMRLLIKIAGELHVGECADLLCQTTLSRLPELSKRFSELRPGPVTSLEDVMKSALSSMPKAILPVVESHLEKARLLRKWRQKQMFETVARALRSSEGQAGPRRS